MPRPPFAHHAPVTLLLAGCILGGEAVAHSQENNGAALSQPPPPAPSTYVVTFPSEPALLEQAARVQSVARHALMEENGIEWMAADPKYVGYPVPVLHRLGEGLLLLEQGRTAYLNLRLEEAVEALQQSLAALNEAAQAVETPEAFGQALLYLGASQVALGQDRNARRTFQRLHEQIPDLEPDPQVFSPPVVTAYESARPRQGSSGETLEVIASPPGTAVYVDFRLQGIAPVTVENVLPGTHAVRLVRPGSVPYVDGVTVRRRRGGRVRATLESAPGAQELPRIHELLISRPLGDRIAVGTVPERLARYLDVDFITFIRVSPGSGDDQVALELAAFETERGTRVLRIHGPSPKQPELLAEASRRLLRQAFAVIRGEDPTPPPQANVATTQPNPTAGSPQEEDDDESLFETWYFWTAVAAVAVAGGVTTAVLVQGGDDPGPTGGGQLILRF